jgi:hypothetical protein
LGTTDQSHLERRRVVQRRHSRAYQRARRRLVELHREEFRAILEAEKRALGIPKLQPRKAAS